MRRLLFFAALLVMALCLLDGKVEVELHLGLRRAGVEEETRRIDRNFGKIRFPAPKNMENRVKPTRIRLFP